MLKVMTAPNIRTLIETANNKGIKKADIVSIVKDNEQYVLVYELKN